MVQATDWSTASVPILLSEEVTSIHPITLLTQAQQLWKIGSIPGFLSSKMRESTLFCGVNVRGRIIQSFLMEFISKWHLQIKKRKVQLSVVGVIGEVKKYLITINLHYHINIATKPDALYLSWEKMAETDKKFYDFIVLIPLAYSCINQYFNIKNRSKWLHVLWRVLQLFYSMQLFKFILTALISCDKPTTVAAQHQMAGSYLVLPAKQLETTKRPKILKILDRHSSYRLKNGLIKSS